VAVGAIARRAMHEGDRDEEDERKLDLDGSSVRDFLSLNPLFGYWKWFIKPKKNLRPCPS
jgi:hypothetical protein